mgnify:CR=1 FL=1
MARGEGRSKAGACTESAIGRNEGGTLASDGCFAERPEKASQKRRHPQDREKRREGAEQWTAKNTRQKRRHPGVAPNGLLRPSRILKNRGAKTSTPPKQMRIQKPLQKMGGGWDAMGSAPSGLRPRKNAQTLTAPDNIHDGAEDRPNMLRARPSQASRLPVGNLRLRQLREQLQ